MAWLKALTSDRLGGGAQPCYLGAVCVSELPFPQLENRKGVFPVGVLRGEVESFLSSPIDHIGDFSYCYKWYYINIWNLGL